MTKRYGRILVLFLVLVTLIFGGMLQAPIALAAAGFTERVSVSSAGAQGDGISDYSSISGDGRYVAFQSAATNLVDGDTNGCGDVFVRDRNTNTTTRVSVSSGGAQADGDSGLPSISSDGRYVAFDSSATNLVTGDTNGVLDVFVRDRNTNTTTRVSLSSAGDEANGISLSPSICADGRYVAFVSSATNLVDGDTNGNSDIFVRDSTLNTTTRINVSSAGAQATGGYSDGPSISGDGRYVAFESVASNLVDGDTNAGTDIFVRDCTLNTTTRVSVSSAGAQAEGGDTASTDSYISGDGRYVAFESGQTNLVDDDTNGRSDIFVRDRDLSTTTRVSLSSAGDEGNGSSRFPSISNDGRYVAFASGANNFVAVDINGDFDIFVRDRTTNTTTRVSIDSAGVQADGYSEYPFISGDGRYVAFQSGATNLVDGDTNGIADVFVTNKNYLGISKDEIGVWRGSTRYFYLDTNGDGKYTNPATERFGTFLTATQANDRPVAGDWDGDGSDEIGVWRGSTRYFYLDTNGDGKYTNPATERFGTFLTSYVSGDMPVAGDWDGDGSDEIGVWRSSTRYFYLDTNGDGKYTNPATERFGPFLSATQANDRPVAGDWDNDGVDEIGVWRGSTRYFYLDTNGDGKYTNPATERFGPFLSATQANDRPVAGDWDGDGVDEIGVWRGSTRYFYLDTNGDGKYTNPATERFGTFLTSYVNGDMPVAGDWDGL